MKRVKVYNHTQALQGPLEAGYAESFAAKLRGLTFRRNLPSDEGLLLVYSRPTRTDSTIHMLGVWFDLGIIWLDHRLQVVDTRLARPWRPIYVPRAPAQFVLEISGERLGEFTMGDQLRLEDVHTY